MEEKHRCMYKDDAVTGNGMMEGDDVCEWGAGGRQFRNGRKAEQSWLIPVVGVGRSCAGTTAVECNDYITPGVAGPGGKWTVSKNGPPVRHDRFAPLPFCETATSQKKAVFRIFAARVPRPMQSGRFKRETRDPP